MGVIWWLLRLGLGTRRPWEIEPRTGSAGAGRGNRTANRVSVSSGKNDLKRLAGSGFRGFNILEDVSLSKCAKRRGVLIAIRPLQGYLCTKDREWVLRHPRGWARPSGLGGNLGFRV